MSTALLKLVYRVAAIGALGCLVTGVVAGLVGSAPGWVWLGLPLTIVALACLKRADPIAFHALPVQVQQPGPTADLSPVNPSTGLPMAGGQAYGVDVGGTAYGQTPRR